MHMTAVHIYSRRQKNGDISVLFRLNGNDRLLYAQKNRMERNNGQATEGRVDYPDCSYKPPEKSKQVKRSIVLAKRLHLEAIGVNWQCKLDQ